MSASVDAKDAVPKGTEAVAGSTTEPVSEVKAGKARAVDDDEKDDEEEEYNEDEDEDFVSSTISHAGRRRGRD